MSYLSLDLNSLVWELKSLIKNNYGGFELNYFYEKFDLAKRDILETFKEIIEDNKEEVFNKLKEELI